MYFYDLKKERCHESKEYRIKLCIFAPNYFKILYRMIKHVVLFQLKDEMAEAEKLQVMKAFKEGILALPAQIPCIKHIEVGFNVNPDEKYEVALSSEFETLEDVNAYAVHPAHVAVAQIIIPHLKARACSDYEI